MRGTIHACLVVSLCVCGCTGSGLQTAEVSGTVQLDGQLVEEGSIQFIPVDGAAGPSAGAVIKDGKYHIPQSKGATVGKNRVELRTFRTTGRKVQDPTGKPGTLTDERIQAFPPKYNEASTVIREVQPGGNTFDFDVKTKEEGR